MTEGFLQGDFEAPLPLLEATSDWFKPSQDLGNMGTLKRVVILDNLPCIVNLMVKMLAFVQRNKS